ncbi:MAG: hypothetical protein ACM3XS_06100 [Bacteroidota bacterium]
MGRRVGKKKEILARIAVSAAVCLLPCAARIEAGTPPALALTLTIPHTSIDFGAVTPFTAQDVYRSFDDCTVRSNKNDTTCEVFVEPNPLSAQFTDASEGVSFPVGQLHALDNASGSYAPLDNVAAKRLDRLVLPRKNRDYPFSFALRLRMTGNEYAGSYSVWLMVTAVAVP